MHLEKRKNEEKEDPKKHMKLITLHLPEKWIQMLDEATDEGYAADRACVIRDAIRDYLQLHHIWKLPTNKE
jgi:metal-responsive CopG/Arc/MetJ family transcriptional regulator